MFSGEQAGADRLLHADGHHARALHPPLLRGRHGPEAALPGPGRGRGQRGPLGLGQPVHSAQCIGLLSDLMYFRLIGAFLVSCF